MIKLHKTHDYVLLEYETELVDPELLAKDLGLIEPGSYVPRELPSIRNTFYVTTESFLSHSEVSRLGDNFFYLEGDEGRDFKDGIYFFIIANRIGEYYLYNKGILDIEYELYIHESMELCPKYFLQFDHISVFRRVGYVYKGERLIIGGPNAMVSSELFEILVSHFPNTTEVKKYIYARISQVLRNEIGSIEDYDSQLTKYVNNRLKSTFRGADLAEVEILHNDVYKLQINIEKLKFMLKNFEGYSENDWQREIIKIIKNIYPKYILAIEKMRIKDFYSQSNREIDIVLVDAAGYMDIIEIKKPKPEGILCDGLYRNNYVPMREMQGTVMQVENYILSLIKMGSEGERRINEHYSNILEEGMTIKIINPKGILIIGLENQLNEKQRNDFEIVKRMYNNVIDIITYDDILRRLDNIMSSIKKQIECIESIPSTPSS